MHFYHVALSKNEDYVLLPIDDHRGLQNKQLSSHRRVEIVLIPGGTFEMGKHGGKPEYDNTPVHTVKIDSFYMDRTEVTVGQFKKFLDGSRPINPRTK